MGNRTPVIPLFLFMAVLFACMPASSEDTAITAADTTAPVFMPDRVIETGGDFRYGLSLRDGFLISVDAGKTWEQRNAGLPTKTVYPFTRQVPRPLTAFGFDPADPERVAVTTAGRLYLSENQGRDWRQIAHSEQFGRNTYFTAVALSPWDKRAMLVGTSFDGIYETRDLGGTWRNIARDLKGLYQGAGFWEEIAALAYCPDKPGQILFACGFGKGLYRLGNDGKTLERIQLPGWELGKAIGWLAYAPAGAGDGQAGEKAWRLEIGARDGLWTLAPQGGEVVRIWEARRAEEPEAARASRRERASGKYGLYLTPNHARGKLLQEHLAFMKMYGLNALVVDLKDDFGYLTYDSQLALPRKIGAVRNTVNLAELLRQAHAAGVYVIARLVVFKDRQLYNYAQYSYAAWDKYSGQPWRNLVPPDDPKVKTPIQKEYWVDPFCPEVWEYNLAVARELAAAGVDEIQFDYIRFPTDGPTARLRYRYMPEGAEKPDALESFLALARSGLQVPISTDLYGFSCWCRVEAWTGQSLEVFAEYVDAVCPMFYPSHFPSGFAKAAGDYYDRARYIYGEGTARANAIADGGTLIRPYVQAFLLGGERRMTAPSYTKYLQSQIDGLAMAPSAGFTLWNQSNRYYMVTKPVR